MVELRDIKVVPCQPSILKFLGDLSFRIPPKHSDIYHARFTVLLYTRGKVGLGCLRGICLESEPDHMLQDRECTREGSSMKTNGFDFKIVKEIGEAFILLVPGVLRGSDNTKSCTGRVS